MNTLGSVYKNAENESMPHIEDSVIYERFNKLISGLNIASNRFILSDGGVNNTKFNKISNSISSYGETITLKSYKVEILSDGLHLDIKSTLSKFFGDLLFEHERGDDARIIIRCDQFHGIGIEVLPVNSIINEDFTITSEKPHLKIICEVI